MELIAFACLATTAVGASVALIGNRNPIYCALLMVVVFVTTGLMFLALSAPFMAALQIIVYAGAIVVLFLFVISYLSLRATPLIERKRVPLLAGVGVALILALELAAVIATLGAGDSGVAGPDATGTGPTLAAVQADFGSVETVARHVFTRYLVPFEITSVLLIVAMVGAVVLAQRVRAPRGRP